MAIVYCGPGSIFESGLQTLVCPVNTQGTLGAGLALKFKQRYRGLLVEYSQACRQELCTTIKPYLTQTYSDGKRILCLATKEHWRFPSQLGYVKNGLFWISKHYEAMGIESLSIPKIGCGLGGLDFRTQVSPLIYRYLDPLPIQVELLV